MREDSPKPASTPTGAVFLSYASQDTGAARRICDALRAAGIEVWFDQNELRGGDAWDRSIRQQIHECRLFVPVISAHTEARDEGYFRREWNLAADRTHDRADDRAFIVPVTTDVTDERTARVPDSFRHVQWTRLPAGETPPAFVDRIKRLLSPEASKPIGQPASNQSGPVESIPGLAQLPSSLKRGSLIVVAVAVLAATAYFAIERPWSSKPARLSPMAAATAAPAAFNPPPHSVAVLPLTNLSGDPKQEYFSDGMTEELITALSQISALKVIARTSAFSFKDKNVNVGTIARVLNVAAILEGSVRRSGHVVRVTVQLIDGSNGFHIWSQNYDRDLKNALAMQSDIATTVAQQLQARLLADERGRIEAGGTENPQALDAYLQGRELWRVNGQLPQATELAEKAVHLDPKFARGWALLSLVYTDHSQAADSPSDVAAWLRRARAAAETAVRLDSRLIAAHAQLARIAAQEHDWGEATREVETTETLDATSSVALNARGNLDFQLGRWQDAIRAARAAIDRDPLRAGNYGLLAAALSASGQHREAVEVYRQALEVEPLAAGDFYPLIALTLLLDHRPGEALAEARLSPDPYDRDVLLAMAYYALGRHQDSDRLLAGLESKYGSVPDDLLGIAVIHAFRSETDLAFQWLDRAVAAQAPGLYAIKGNLGLYPNINSDPRYHAILRKLGLPE